ncbi:MAG: protein translocase subunit SecF [Candidatus Pacebacteria bacterium]|nr:protein translocase subunit SecF [Candidatus Paceibacterota bacterium]
MFIVKNRKIWYALSGIVMAASIFAIFFFGLKQGIEFTGGSLLEAEYKNTRPETAVLQEAAGELGLGNVIIQPSGEKGIIVRAKELNEEEHQRLLAGFSSKGELAEIRFDSIGPTIGKELRQKSITAIIMVIVAIVLYIAFAFRKVSRPVSSFKYGLITVAALAHDVVIPTGVFAYLGKYYGVEIDALFITALLTILGFSVHDTIVVFDRVRENIKISKQGEDFEQTVGSSVSQTIGRSINTSLTVVLVLLALYFFGGESTKYFSLALIIGVVVGTYSSIFIASPLLATVYKRQDRKK